MSDLNASSDQNAIKTVPGIVQAEVYGTNRTGRLPETISIATINKVLGFTCEGPSDDGDGKVDYEWYFTWIGHEAGIWDYKGARWSVYDPDDIIDTIFADAIALEGRR